MFEMLFTKTKKGPAALLRNAGAQLKEEAGFTDVHVETIQWPWGLSAEKLGYSEQVTQKSATNLLQAFENLRQPTLALGGTATVKNGQDFDEAIGHMIEHLNKQGYISPVILATARKPQA